MSSPEADENPRVKRGDKYRWDTLDIEVIRVARDQAWADIFTWDWDSGTGWSKRQPLPFPDSFTKAVSL